MLRRLKSFFNPQPNPDDPTAPWRVFWVALALRLLYMTLAHTYRIRLSNDHFEYGWEMGRIARALVTGHGYSDPFANLAIPHTGPTAWVPPAYPLIMAAVFRLFGVYTRASAWVLLAINCVLSAATAMAVWELGFRFANRRVALWSGWLWALYPAAMQYAVRWVWEMTLTTAIFTWVFVLALRMRADPDRNILSRWAYFGLAWGLIALSNSTLLLFLPICALWILLGSRTPRALTGAALAGLLFLATIAPWTARNWLAFHAFIPMRGNLGAEMYMGNGPDAEGLLMEYNHPFQSPPQLRLYAGMGEVAYVKMRGTAAGAAIAADRPRFLRNTLKRVYFFWVSVPHPSGDHWYVEFFRILNFSFVSLAGLLGLALALHRRRPAAMLFAWAFLLLPVPYYIVTAHARFRHPLEPLICILAAYLFQSAEKTRTRIRGFKAG